MKHFLVVAVILGFALAGCSRPTAEQMFDRAMQAEQAAMAKMDSLRYVGGAKEAYAPAIAAFENVRREYPTHPLSEAALFRLANIRNNHTEEFDLAVDAYREYVRLYPDGQQTELSMFLIGYLYNNNLHNLDSAGAAYRRFLTKYPESSYAVSAQFELNTLGKSPDELIPPQAPPAKEEPKKGSRKSSVKPNV
jgi:outer membrane protein assembly factor BamD (BamD/ComL family)